MFDQGKAAANDVTIDGLTLFAAANLWLWSWMKDYVERYYHSPFHRSGHTFSELQKDLRNLANLYRKVISLFKSAGCTFEACAYYGDYYATFFYQALLPAQIDLSEFYDIAETLCDLGSQIDLTDLQRHDHNGFGSTQRKIEHFISKTKQ